MRNIFNFWIIGSFTISGCVTSYFKTPNDVYKTSATIYLEDGAEKTGELTTQFETGFDALKFITLFHKETGNTENINIENIKYYKVNNNCYVPKKIDLNLNGTYHLLFVKRLTEESSKIHLYELPQLYKSTGTGEDRTLYFISFSTHSKYEVWSIYSKKLLPDFEYKMSDVVSDCPSLAEKIKEKNKDYYIPRVSFPDSKKLEIYKRIIAEYNNCH